MESIVSKELDYKKVNYVHPTYRMNRIYAQSGSTTQIVSTSGGQENIFEIPIAPFNLSKSYFTFTAVIPEVNTKYIITYADVFTWFRQMQIYTRGGVYLMDLNELSNYTKVVWNAELNLLEFLDLDSTGTGVTAADSIGTSSMLARSNALATASFRPTGGANTTTTVGSNSSISYTEKKYVMNALVVGDGAGAGNLSINVNLPLKLLKNTICSIDKDIYVGEVLQLRIIWQGTQKIYFSADTITATFANPVTAVGSVNISNMALYLATEKNPLIVNQLAAKVAEGGFQLLIPYVYTYKNNIVGQNVSTSLRFNRGHGKNLQKIYYAAFNSGENKNVAYDTNNVPSALNVNPVINYYYTLLNNNRLQEYNMVCNQQDDYKLLVDKLRGSITQNSNIYNYNQFWVDDFCNFSKMWDDNSNMDCGLDLSVEQKWDIYLTLSGTLSLNHYAFAVTQKQLTVSTAGVTVL